MSNEDTKGGVKELQLRPAFATNFGALAFLTLMLFLLILPLIIGSTGLITRRHSYQIMPENQGAYTFAEQETFEKKGDIDILVLGSSVIWNAIDTRFIQSELSKSLGRPATVITFGNYFNSIDIPYNQLNDLLQRRRVRMVVFSVPRMPYTDGPSTTAYKFIRYNDNTNVTDDLPFQQQISLYACSILRAPHDLLTIARTNRSKPSPYIRTLGANEAEMGMGRDPSKFARLVPAIPNIAKSSLIYSGGTRTQFSFINAEITDYQSRYLDAMVDLLREENVPLVMLNIPQYSERHERTAIERVYWAKWYGDDIPLIGISPKILFEGLSEDEVERLHYDDEHMNANGSEFFTKIVSPAIVEVYKNNAAKSF
ncbi:MAG: hypothetical protein ABL984_04150 [Pyrinomonadaceae bacterium]